MPATLEARGGDYTDSVPVDSVSRVQRQRARGPGPSGRQHASRVRALEIRDVVARERHGVLAPCDLHLEHHLSHVAEGDLAAGEIEFPHAPEACVIQGLDPGAVLLEAPAPLPERRSIVEAKS